MTQALTCMEETRSSICQSSPFVSNHHGECNTTNKRELEEEEAEVAPTLLLNSSRVVPTANSKNMITTRCDSEKGQVRWMGDGWCMAWKFKKYGFVLTIKWGNVVGSIGLMIKCEACVPL